MRLLRLIALLSIVVALMATPALAKQAAPHATQAPQMQHLEGKVSSVDPQNNTLAVEPRPGLGAVTLHVTGKTRFEGPGVKDLRSVREGEHIRASYVEQDGQNVAETVNVIPEGRGGAQAPAGGAAEAPAKAPAEQQPPQAVPSPPSTK